MTTCVNLKVVYKIIVTDVKAVVTNVAADIFQRWYDLLIVSGGVKKCAQCAPEQTAV